MGKISTSPRYVIDISVKYPLSLVELGGGLILKNKKNEVFLTSRRNDRILMKVLYLEDPCNSDLLF